jgi:multisubunit Na+/H+ antiporter MnhB subunit
MTAAHLHLLVAHLPVVGTLLGLGLFILALLRKSEEQRRTVLALLGVLGLLALPTYLSGPPAASQLKRAMPGLPPDLGDQHAEVAILALSGSLVTGAVALVGLLAFRKRPNLPGGFLAVVLALALIAALLLAWTANLGAKIRHTEIRPNTAAVTAPGLHS